MKFIDAGGSVTSAFFTLSTSLVILLAEVWDELSEDPMAFDYLYNLIEMIVAKIDAKNVASKQ